MIFSILFVGPDRSRRKAERLKAIPKKDSDMILFMMEVTLTVTQLYITEKQNNRQKIMNQY